MEKDFHIILQMLTRRQITVTEAENLLHLTRALHHVKRRERPAPAGRESPLHQLIRDLQAPSN